MKTKAFGFLILLCLSLSACVPKQDPAVPEFTNDPRIPGGTIGTNPGLQKISKLNADVSKPLEIKLSWSVPALYLTKNYQVLIYKKQCAADGVQCSAPNPKTTASDPVYKGKETTFLDTEIQAGITFSYWVFLQLEDDFSDAVLIRAIPTAGISSLNSITADNFWPSSTFKIGLTQTNGEPLPPSANNLGIKKIQALEIAGKMATSKNGAVLYYADTKNNRIVTMIKQIALQCDEANFSDPLLLQFCMMQSIGEPFIPWNVIGQPNQRTNLSCQEHQVRCETSIQSVKKITKTDGSFQWQLMESPTSTNVISTYGSEVDANSAACDQMNFCSFEGVEANSAKRCNARRDECMTAPTHIAVDGNKLLVTDAGNNRVLVYDKFPVKDGCDTDLGGDLLITRNCTASTAIGKKSALDLNDYSLATDGDKALKDPGAVVAKDGNLFIADRGNNRVVRVRGYSDRNIFSCQTNENSVPNGIGFGPWNPLCKFDQVLGQQTLFQNKTFKEIVLEKAALDIDVIRSESPSNSLTPDYRNLLRRYFGRPSHLAFSEGKLLISSYEDFMLTSAEVKVLRDTDPRYENFYIRRIDSPPIALKSRILIFNEDKLAAQLPSCQPSVFDVGGCDAESVIGQLDFETIPVFSGDTADDYRNGVNYGLTYVTDFIVDGKTLMATDGLTNDIYFWKDWTTPIQGRPFNFRIENPSGAAFPSNPNMAMPNAKSITGMLFDPMTGGFTISDPGSGRLYMITRPR